jgi:oxygen-independent coproporphyrinogen-3 oxidase
MFLGLRLVEGVSRRAFAARYGIDPAEGFPKALASLTAARFLRRRGDRLALTARGRRLGNAAFAAFLPENY